MQFNVGMLSECALGVIRLSESERVLQEYCSLLLFIAQNGLKNLEYLNS